MGILKCSYLIWAAVVLTAIPAWSQQAQDLSDKSIEELMNIQVTSVSKTGQTLSQVASAIFVITQEDIRNSGATNIPDLLRMVPGLEVGQINSNPWAVSARGFNGRYSNELLVLMDGRTVYIPSFGGVYWDVFDLPLEDIERIEVIRGPGGSIWGANAVNGVVNVITKKADVTQGAMVVAGGGNLDQGFATLQYGGSAGRETHYRVYSKYFNQSRLPGETQQNGGDQWRVLRNGFRLDSNLSSKDTLTVQGDLYNGQESQLQPILPSVTSPTRQIFQGLTDVDGGFVQAVWNRNYANGSDTSLSASFDRFARLDILPERRNTAALDFQYHFAWGHRQDIVVGANDRYSSSVTRGSLAVSFNPADLATNLFGAFLQDQIAIVQNRLHLTIGAKLEHNYYTGFGLMPSARFVWTLNPHQALWGAVSRALQTPSENEASIRINLGGFPGPGGTPELEAIVGNRSFEDTGLIAYELGYRATLGESFSVDIAAYDNDYDHLQTTEPSTPFLEATPPPLHLVLPKEYANLMYGETHGFEIFANWKLSGRWTLRPGYAFEQIDMRLDPSSRDTTSVALAEGSSPADSGQLRSHFKLPDHFVWDATSYFVSRIADPAAPSYTRLDTGLTWQRGERLSLSVVGQNLLKDRRLEYVDFHGSVTSSLIKRSAYAEMAWHF